MNKLFLKVDLFITRGKKKDNSAEKNKLKKIAPASNNEFGLPNGPYSVSYIQYSIEYTIKKYEILPTNPPFSIYINRINGRLVFKKKDGYKVELQTLEFMKLFEYKKFNSQHKE